MVLAALIALVVVMRLLPHPPNVAPVAAVALFAGWFFANRWVGIAAPLAAMLASDALIGGYDPRLMAVVYGSLIVPALFRRLMGDGSSLKRTFAGAAAGSLAGSVLFFVVTNLAVWAFGSSYAPTLNGLGACYAAALPFFKYTVGGDLAFAMTLFGAWAAVRTIGRVGGLHAAAQPA